MKALFEKVYKKSAKQRADWRRYYRKNREKIIAKSTAWLKAHRELQNAKERERRKRLRVELIAAYGSKCACCGELEPRFLTLEHTNKDGAIHRRNVGGNYPIYVDLKRRGYPTGDFTLLCWNCNCAERYGEKCPHKIRRDQCAFLR